MVAGVTGRMEIVTVGGAGARPQSKVEDLLNEEIDDNDLPYEFPVIMVRAFL